MSLPLPSRRVLGTAPTIFKTFRPTLLIPGVNGSALPSTACLSLTQTRLASRVRLSQFNRSELNDRNRKAERHSNLLEDMSKAATRREKQEASQKRMTAVRLESDSIFGEDITAAREDASEEGRERREGKERSRSETFMGGSLVAQHMRYAIDPDPASRRRWERKMVLRQVTRVLDPAGRETRNERIKRTEREVNARSPWLATSTKKLMHLARQISGKTVEEARTQMKFSKKKFAKEVLIELDHVRDKAIVERGMGLGKVNGEYVPGKTEPVKVRDQRHGKWVTITDPTRMYISEAWVNRGPWRGRVPNYRARGRVDVMQLPQASITIKLKEEKTRIREDAEKKAKEARKAPWVHLPNRPVTAQRPFYSW